MLNYYLPLFIVGMIWMKDTSSGIIDRCKVHNVFKEHFFIAHLLTMVVFSILSAILVMFAIIPTFHLQYDTVTLNIFLLIWLQTIGSVVIGLLIGLTSNYSFDFLMKINFIVFPAIFFSEIFWPANNDNLLTQTLSSLYPLKKTTVAFRALIFEKLRFTDYLIYVAFEYSIVHTFILLLLCFICIQIRK